MCVCLWKGTYHSGKTTFFEMGAVKLASVSIMTCVYIGVIGSHGQP